MALALVPKERAGGGSGDGVAKFSAEEIFVHGRRLGINPVFEPDLLWIAEQALGAPLPPHWLEHVTPAGDVYFANSLTRVTSWDHPLEDEFRALAESVRQRKRQQAAAVSAAAADARDEDEDDEDGRSERSYEDDTEYDESEFESSRGTSLGTSFGTSLGQSQSFRRGWGGGSEGDSLNASRKRVALPAMGAVGFVRDPRLAGGGPIK